MDFGFTEDQEALRKSAREVLGDKSTAADFRRIMATDDAFDESLWKTVGELGWLGVAIPEADGGLGLGWVEQSILLEETGRAILPAPYLSAVALAVPVLLAADKGGIRDALLAALAAGETRVTLAAIEEEGRWDAPSLQTTAEKSGDGWRISGAKVFVPDAHVAHELIVLARTGAGTTLFAVPASEARITQLATLDASRRLCEVVLDGVVVGADRVLGAKGEGWSVLQRALDRAAVAFAAEETGIAQQVLDMTVDYARQREQFGKPIGSFQANSHKLSEMLLLTESARSSTYYAAWALDEGTPDAPLAAASARVAGIEAGRYATAEGIQIHGGIGFTWEHDLHLYFKRAKWDELYLGDGTVWRERVASLLAG